MVQPPAKAIRHRLALSREVFAVCFGIPIATLVSWERNEAEPTATETAYLRLIARNPAAGRLVPA
jgi:DNA-binding transcriptional regulator YiaG